MKLFGKCGIESCHRTGFFIRKRVFNAPGVGPITSQKEMCGSCASRIRNMVK